MYRKQKLVYLPIPAKLCKLINYHFQILFANISYAAFQEKNSNGVRNIFRTTIDIGP